MSLQTTRPIPLHALKTNAVRPGMHWVQRVLAWLMPGRYTRLDIDNMPPHLQRDLGFLDGRDPRYEPAERR